MEKLPVDDYVTLLKKCYQEKMFKIDVTDAKCDTCAFRKSIPGDSHISCGIVKDEELTFDIVLAGLTSPMPLMADVTLGHYGRMAVPLVAGDEAGFAGGWFTWPMNFDPVWLRICFLWRAKDETNS